MQKRKKYPASAGRNSRSRLSLMKSNYQIYLLLLPSVLFFLIFCYGPMYGVQIAFKDFSTGLGITGSPWVGLKHFRRFIDMTVFWNVFKNTLLLSFYNLLVNFPIPIIVALMVNEVKEGMFKKDNADRDICAAFYFHGDCLFHADPFPFTQCWICE